AAPASRSGAGPHATMPGSERVSDPVAYKIEAEDGQHDCQSGKDRDPRGALDEGSALVEDRSPGRVRWLRTESQERERCFGQQSEGEGDRRLHDDGSDDIWHDMSHEDPRSGGAKAPGCLDVVAFLLTQHGC